MSLTPRWALVGLLLVLVGPILARSLTESERPVPHVPRHPTARKDLDRREAQRLYALGAVQERNNRLVEAMRAYEDAERLDPDSAAIPRALFGLYLALERHDDALAACKKVLRIDPDDVQTGYLHARQLRGMDRRTEAIAALNRTSASPRLKERPELAAQVWFDLALLHEQASSWALAEKALRQVASILDTPTALIESGKYSREEIVAQAAETYERLGRICLKAGRVEDAIQAFDTARKKDSLRAPRMAYNLAQVYRDQGRLRDALNQLDLYLRSQPQGVEGYEMKIALQRKLGRYADVVPDLERSSARDPHNVALKLLLAREYRNIRRGPAAEQIYAKLLEIHVTPDVYRGLFDLYREDGAAGAERILTRLDSALDNAMGDDKKAGNPSDARRGRAMLAVLREDAVLVRQILPVAIRRTGARKLSFATRGVLATLAARTKQLPEAEQLYRSCLERPALPASMEAEVYAGLLRVLALQYKFAAIIEVCKEGLAKAQQTNRVMFHLELVRAYQHEGDHKAALAAADAAVGDAGKPQLLTCKRRRVDALVQAGEKEKALAECQVLLKEYNQGGELRDVRALLSTVYQAMGKLDEAEEQLVSILRLEPNDATVNNDLGYLWADRNKNLVEAEGMIRKALDLDRQQRTSGTSIDPDSEAENAAFVDSLGWVLFRRGKLDEAQKELEKASRLPHGEDDPVVWDHLGDVFQRQEKTARAVECWKKAVSLYEQGARRKTDPRYREIQDKIRQVLP